MTDGALHRTAQFRSRSVWLVGGIGIAVTAVLVVVAWLFVAPPPTPQRVPVHASTLEDTLFERARGGAEAEAAGANELEIAHWCDLPPAQGSAALAPGTHACVPPQRAASDVASTHSRPTDGTDVDDRNPRFARIPIDLAIDAVVANPSLIGGHK